MSDKVVYVQNGDKVYAVPTKVCEEHELTGAKLTSAQELLEASSGDVEGQCGNSTVIAEGATCINGRWVHDKRVNGVWYSGDGVLIR